MSPKRSRTTLPRVSRQRGRSASRSGPRSVSCPRQYIDGRVGCVAPLDQPRLASLPTRGRVHRPGLPRRRVPGHEPPETSSRRQCQRKLLPRHGLSRSSSTEDGFSGNPSSESGSSESGPSGAAPRVRLSSEARTSRDTLQRAPELTCGRLRCPMATTTPPSAILGRCGCHRRRRRSSCASEISDSSSAPSCRDRGPRRASWASGYDNNHVKTPRRIRAARGARAARHGHMLAGSPACSACSACRERFVAGCPQFVLPLRSSWSWGLAPMLTTP